MAFDEREYVFITEEPLNVQEAIDFVSVSSAGAISVFIGTTRDTFDGKEVIRLEYESYIPMAKKEMLGVCKEMFAKWPIQKMIILHRIGVVPVKEASVVIAASSAHRKEAIEAVHEAIDELKRRVPIWKKEVYNDGDAAWKGDEK